MAKLILEENKDYIGDEIAQEAIRELEKQIEQEEAEPKKKTTRTRKTKKEGSKAWERKTNNQKYKKKHLRKID